MGHYMGSEKVLAHIKAPELTIE